MKNVKAHSYGQWFSVERDFLVIELHTFICQNVFDLFQQKKLSLVIYFLNKIVSLTKKMVSIKKKPFI